MKRSASLRMELTDDTEWGPRYMRALHRTHRGLKLQVGHTTQAVPPTPTKASVGLAGGGVAGGGECMGGVEKGEVRQEGWVRRDLERRQQGMGARLGEQR